MPHVTTGNTMAPCVITGERAGETMILRGDNKLFEPGPWFEAYGPTDSQR